MLHRDRERLALGAAGGERAVGARDPEPDVAADERERLVLAEHARQQPRLGEDLEAVADSEHEAAVAGELGDRLHDRREARDRAAAEVVAVGEPAGEDDACGAGGKLRVVVPDAPGVRAEARQGELGVAVVVRAGEDDDGDPGPELFGDGHHAACSSIS